MRYLFIVFISVFINLNVLAVPTHVTEFDISVEEPIATGITFNPNGSETFNTKLDYKRNINGFDIIFGSNYNFMSQIPDYGVNFILSSTF